MDGGGREIWFRRTGWNYLPCHWKGWLLVVVTVPTVVAVEILISQALPRPAPLWLILLAVAPGMAGFLWLRWITLRHCAPRR